MTKEGTKALNTLIMALMVEKKWDDVKICVNHFASDVDGANADKYLEYLIASCKNPKTIIKNLLDKGLKPSMEGSQKFLEWSYANKHTILATRLIKIHPNETNASRLVDIGCILNPAGVYSAKDTIIPLISEPIKRKFVDSLLYSRKFVHSWEVAAQCNLPEYFSKITEVVLNTYNPNTITAYLTEARIIERLYDLAILVDTKLAYKLAEWLATHYWKRKYKQSFENWAKLRATRGLTKEEKNSFEAPGWQER